MQDQECLEVLAGAQERKKERKKWRTSLSPKAMGPRAAAGGKCAVQGAGDPVRNAGKATDHLALDSEPG